MGRRQPEERPVDLVNSRPARLGVITRVSQEGKRNGSSDVEYL